MSGGRKAAAYSKMRVVPYTRKSKIKSKSFIKAVPPSTVVKFFMGNIKAFQEGKLPYQLMVVSKYDIQIRDGAIEACRQYLNKQLETNFMGQYFFKIMAHPHHIQRENKMLTQAGADRMSTGMQLSFGKAIDRAALVNKNGGIFFFALQNKRIEQEVRKMLHIVQPKLPCKTRVISEEKKLKQ